MATKKTTEESSLNIDDILGNAAPSAPVAETTPAPVPDMDEIISTTTSELDAEDAELAALQAELAKPAPKVEEFVSSNKITPDAELTEKQLAIREAKDALAKKRALENEQAAQTYETASSANVVIIHILEDGFTVNGEICYRGRELHFDRDGMAYKQTLDRNGVSWLDLADDTDAQFERWGSMKFASGPWRGRRFDQLTLKDLPEGASEADLASAKKAAARLSHAAPVAINR